MASAGNTRCMEETETTQQDSDAQQSAQDEQQARDDAREEMKRVEENPPDKLEDWPGGKAKYMTMGGPEGESGYEDGPTSKLGPSSLRHHEGGDVSIEGEKVDNPEDYKGEPIPGGPTDPDAPDDPAMLENERGEKTDHAEDGADSSGGGESSAGGGQQDEQEAEQRESEAADRGGYGDRGES